MPLSNCNEAQAHAVRHFLGPMLLTAGPGSGKTFTMIERIRYLIEHYGAESTKILVITFTKAAAAEMQKRFFEAVKEKAYPVQFGTFHAIFFHILKQTYHYHSGNIISEKEKREYMEYALEGSSKKADDALKEQLLSEFSKVKNSEKGIRDYSFTGGFMEPEEFRGVYRKYRAICRERRKMDFDDMALQCLDLFRKREDILKKWQNAFRFVLIDEFQDINAAQYAVIKLLVKEHGNLFAVGDDDQSIYGFRGADPGIMQRFLKDYPQAVRGNLSRNYRSGKDIIEASMKVISENENRIPKTIQAGTEREGSVEICGFCGREQEYERIREELVKYHARRQLKNCALIFRTNQGVINMKKRLLKDGIPFYGEEKQTSGAQFFAAHFVVRDMEDYIRFARGEQSRERFLRIMNKPSRFISRESLGCGEVDMEAVKRYYAGDREKQKTVEKLQADLAQLKAFSPFLAVTFIRKAIGYDNYLTEYAGEWEKEEKKKLQEIVEQVQQDAAEYRNMEAWLLSLEERRRESCQKGHSGRKAEQNPATEERGKGKACTEEDKGEEDKVTLITMHGAKGLEYDTVFLPGVTEGTVPYGKLLSKEEEEEERRIFYVAMTRAKNRLVMTYTEKGNDKPSHFLSGLL